MMVSSARDIQSHKRTLLIASGMHAAFCSTLLPLFISHVLPLSIHTEIQVRVLVIRFN